MTPQELTCSMKCAVEYGGHEPPGVALVLLTDWLSDNWEILSRNDRTVLIGVGETLTAMVTRIQK